MEFICHIQGKMLPSLKLAQRSAAFEAIKQLHQCGELSENLLPINRQKCLANFKEVYFKSWEGFPNGNGIYQELVAFEMDFVVTFFAFYSSQIIPKQLAQRKIIACMI